MLESREERLSEAKETARLEAFSDGVFAIAITLLVLDIKVPEPDLLKEKGIGLAGALLDEWPIYVAYVTSFITVLIMWANHHTLIDQVKRSDRQLLFLNGLLLMSVTIVPFPTSLLARYIKEPAGAPVAAAVYGATFTAIAILFNLVWWYAARNNRLLDRQADPAVARTITRRYIFGPGLYLAGTLLALLNPTVGLLIFMLMALFFALPASKRPFTT